MSDWPEVRRVLRKLRDDPRRPLLSYPDPRADDRQPPYSVRLHPWAADIAADLTERFGDDVDLTVGSLHYPERRTIPPAGVEPRERLPADHYPLLPMERMTASLDEPLIVLSGHTARSGLRLHNYQNDAEVIQTNGQLTARIVDPASGEVVGGSAGPQNLSGIRFEAPARGSVVVPLLVGTASSASELGYAVPAGEWAFDAIIHLQDGRHRIASLPMTVIAQRP